MKLKIRYNKVALTISFLVGFAGLFFACNDEWNEHYDNPQTENERSLLSALKQDPELSMFIKMIEISGLSQRMDGTDAYTVWAPTDSALKVMEISLENLSAQDSVKIKSLTENHIARYFYSTSEIEFNKKRVLMLSKKYIYFEKTGNRYVFDEQPLTSVNCICSNGVLHKMNGSSKYRDNLWEYLKNTPELKTVYDFISQYDSTYLDEKRSKPIEINEYGYTVYDSVLIFNNKLLNRIGELNLEDSIYTLIAPTQTAYSKTFDLYKNYYKSNGGKDGKLNPDSITQHYTDSVIVNNLVFRGEYQNLQNRDSVSTTTGTIFKKNWREMFNGEFYKASNGDIMITDNLNQNIYESVHKTLKRDFRYMAFNSTSGFITEDADVSWENPQEDTKVNEAIGGFLLLREAKGISSSPVLSVYPGKDVVSSKYDIVCTVIPGTASDSLNTGEQTVLDFRLQYRLGKSNKRIELKKGLVTDSLHVMQIELKDVEIPFIDVDACLSITVNLSSIPIAERGKYKKQVRIKEVTFKPAGVTD